MFYKMLFDRFVDFAYLYTVLDMPRQIRIVCLHNGAVLCFVNNGKFVKTQHRARATLNVRSPEVTKGIPITWYVSNVTVWDTNEASVQC